MRQSRIAAGRAVPPHMCRRRKKRTSVQRARIAPVQTIVGHHNPIDLNLLSPSITHELQERLLNADSTQSMISLLDQYIFRLIIKTKVDSQLIRYATGLIVNNTSKDSLLYVQKEIHVTEKTFQRLFIKSIGIAPNLYRRICQFNAAFQQLNNRRFTKLSDIAFDNGYADQSHYIRVFREFTGITPNEYLNYGS